MGCVHSPTGKRAGHRASLPGNFDSSPGALHQRANRPYTPPVRFTCPNCGARFGSADEPASGRVYSVRCRCGTKLNLAAAAPPARALAAGARYDPYAASQGLLLDEAEARSLAAGQPILEPAIQAVGGEEVEVTFSTLLEPPRSGKTEAEAHGSEKAGGARNDRPTRGTRRPKEQDEAPVPVEGRAPVGRTAWVPPFWSSPLAALLAFVLAGGGTAWVLLPQAGVHSIVQLLDRFSPLAAAHAATPPERAPQGEPLAPAAPPPEAAAAPAPEVAATPAPEVAVAPAPEPDAPRAADPPRRASGKTAGGQRGKVAPARDRKLARRVAADRR